MTKPVSSRTTSCAVAFIVGLSVFTVGCVGDLVFLANGSDPLLAVMDDFSLGAFAAALVLYYEWRRSVQLRNRLSVIAQMNHHVRNQLEVIEYSAWATHDQVLIARMNESVARIDWALREILGKRYRDTAVLPPAKPPRSATHTVNHQSQSAD